MGDRRVHRGGDRRGQWLGDAGRAWIAFDPATLRKAWFHRYPGNMVGFTTCVVATIAQYLYQKMVDMPSTDGADEGLETVLCHAIGRMRKLHVDGYRGGSEHDAFKEELNEIHAAGMMTHDLDAASFLRCSVARSNADAPRLHSSRSSRCPYCSGTRACWGFLPETS